MNSLVETLNQWGANFLSFAWPMFWQSSLLIAGLLTVDLLFRRKLRASIRYALWLVVLVKLCVPPTLALPTSPVWWLHKTPAPVVAKSLPHYTVTYDNGPLPEISPKTLPATVVPPKPVMTNAAWLVVVSTAVSSALLLWLLVRWWQITWLVWRATPSERLTSISDTAKKFICMRLKVQVKLTTNSMSPAVCGLFRPAILIPQSLAENFSDEQLRAVLLRMGDSSAAGAMSGMNFLQTLSQIVYWWHPLVWLANARIRRVREEAVDDAVMLALRDEAETYAPTLLEVAKPGVARRCAGEPGSGGDFGITPLAATAHRTVGGFPSTAPGWADVGFNCLEFWPSLPSPCRWAKGAGSGGGEKANSWFLAAPHSITTPPGRLRHRDWENRIFSVLGESTSGIYRNGGKNETLLEIICLPA